MKTKLFILLVVWGVFMPFFTPSFAFSMPEEYFNKELFFWRMELPSKIMHSACGLYKEALCGFSYFPKCKNGKNRTACQYFSCDIGRWSIAFNRLARYDCPLCDALLIYIHAWYMRISQEATIFIDCPRLY